MNNLSNHIRIRKKTNLSPLSNKYRMALKGGKNVSRRNLNKKRSHINIVKLPQKDPIIKKKDPIIKKKRSS